MRKFEIIAYTKSDATIPVEDFIHTLNPKMIAKTLRELELLADFGNELREPYTKHLSDGIFELRIKHGRDLSRVLYFFVFGKKIVLTNGFIKKTLKTPNKEISLAKKYRHDYFVREEQSV